MRCGIYLVTLLIFAELSDFFLKIKNFPIIYMLNGGTIGPLAVGDIISIIFNPDITVLPEYFTLMFLLKNDNIPSM